MHLRSRRNIRPPRRFDEEDFTSSRAGSTPRTQSNSEDNSPPSTEPRILMPPSVRPQFPPPYVEYNPNNPPAAFPTLDNPLPRPKPDVKVVGKGSDDELEVDQQRMDIDEDEINSDEVEPEEAEFPEICDMETTDEEEDDNMQSDNDQDGGNYGIDPAQFQNVVWTGISPILQIEIIENLSQRYNWQQIVIMLHLSPEDIRVCMQHADARKEQARKENRLLHEMQIKQRAALLRIDNSALQKSQVPAQLVFRKISRQYLRGMRARPDPNYLMSTAKEVITARCYLRRAGLDPRFAGEWGCELAAIQEQTGPNPNLVEELKWTLEADEDTSVIAQDTVAAMKPTRPPRKVAQRKKKSVTKEAEPPTSDQVLDQMELHTGNEMQAPAESVLNITPIPDESIASELRKENGEPIQAEPTIVADSNTDNTDKAEEPVVHVNVGPEGAARIGSSPGASSPSTRALPPSPGVTAAGSLTPHVERMNSGAATVAPSSKVQSSTIPENIGSPEQTQLREKPVQRSLSGAWWYDLNTPKGSDLGADLTPARQLQGRLLSARAENEIRHLARSGGQVRASSAPRLTHLPFRNSPLKYHCECEDTRARATPPAPSSDCPSVLDSSPTRRVVFDKRVSQATPEYSTDAHTEDRGPPYSPISPADADTATLKKHSENGMDSAESGKAINAGDPELPPEKMDLDIDNPSPRDSQPNDGSTRETLEFQISPIYATETTPSGSLGSRQSSQSLFPEASEEISQLSENQNGGLSNEQPEKKPRKRKGKLAADLQRRKSARLNPTEARTLRSKPKVSYKV